MLRPHFLATAFAASALVLAAGCGGSGQDASSGTEAASETPVTVHEFAVEQADGSAVAGAPLVAEASPATLGEVLAHPERYEDQLVRVTAPIDQVCQSSGCWMIVGDETTQSRVTFADYGFFVPKDVAGRTVEMDVRVERSTLSVEEARHYASETEGEDPEKIDAPVPTVSIVATGVRILPSPGGDAASTP